MATDIKTEVGELTYENIVKFARAHDDPCITAGEIATQFDISNEAANYRLQQLRERGEMVDKQVGASAKVWFIKG